MTDFIRECRRGQGQTVCTQAYPSQCHEMLFDVHTRSFAGAGRYCRARGSYTARTRR